MKFSRLEEKYYSKGYRIDKEGTVTSNKGKKLKLTLDYSGYLRIGKRFRIHRLQAYTKFGDKIYEKGQVVRHLNNNKLDNSWNNISIGTQKENLNDNEYKYKVSYKRKIDINTANYIRNYCFLGGISAKTMSKNFNMDTKSITNIIKYKTYLDNY